MEIKLYHTLPQEGIAIRKTVFVEEQGFLDEFDEIDAYAHHLVLFLEDGRKPAAVCRFFKEPENGRWTVGRIAVLKPYRGRNLGALLLQAAEKEIGKRNGAEVFLHAQVRAGGFYKKQGYSAVGEVDFDEDCPHIWMRKTLKAAETFN